MRDVTDMRDKLDLDSTVCKERQLPGKKLCWSELCLS